MPEVLGGFRTAASAGSPLTPHSFYVHDAGPEEAWLALGYDYKTVPFAPSPLASDPTAPAQGESFERGVDAATPPPTTFGADVDNGVGEPTGRILNPSGVTFAPVLEYAFRATAPTNAEAALVAELAAALDETLPGVKAAAQAAAIAPFVGTRTAPRVEIALDIGVPGAPIYIKPKGETLAWGEGWSSYHTDSFSGSTFRLNGARVVAKLHWDPVHDPEADSPPDVVIRAANLTLNSN